MGENLLGFGHDSKYYRDKWRCCETCLRFNPLEKVGKTLSTRLNKFVEQGTCLYHCDGAMGLIDGGYICDDHSWLQPPKEERDK